MISKNGRDIWKEIEKIGPPMKSNKIPEDIICPNGTITGNLVDVLNSWAKSFCNLYIDTEDDNVGFDNNFLQVARNYIASEAPSRETQTNQLFNNPISFHEVSHHLKLKTEKLSRWMGYLMKY